jgi:hypothetical protein
MIRTMSERLKRFRGGVVWPWTADSIDIAPELRSDSLALAWALAYLAVDDAISDKNTAVLSAYLYRRVSGAPAPLFVALSVSPNGERRAELALALRPPLDPTTESIVAGFVCDASRQLVDLRTEGVGYWDDRPTPPFYQVARFQIMAGWGALSPAMRARVRPFVKAGLPDEYQQLFGDADP